ncbi:hypothetical protein KIW84_053757 [Lathyrus oleraceus]|uniref:Uncharacterized protein n=1 Tax=Pisum sativum TaxID=3888 RepID=A0A9D4WR91_PEA|nr:hypothetical protein KIW84_053757 [Pisum sativum]
MVSNMDILIAVDVSNKEIHLSHLLFCLAEDVISRSISKLVSQGVLELIKSSRNNLVPSLIFYVDVVLIFCSGKMSNINSLKTGFQEYSMDYGHCLNLGKSSIYSSLITESNVNSIIASSGFSRGSFPFNYLGILIFKGRIKYSYLSHSSDVILNKLSAWKGSLLYMDN